MELLKKVEEQIKVIGTELKEKEKMVEEGKESEEIQDDIFELQDTLLCFQSIEGDIKTGREIDSTQEAFLRMNNIII